MCLAIGETDGDTSHHTYAQIHTYIQPPVSASSLHVCVQLTVVRKRGHSTRFELEGEDLYRLEEMQVGQHKASST